MTTLRSSTSRPSGVSGALSLGFGVGFELLQIRAYRCAVNRVELRIGFAGLPGLPELHERLAEVEQAVGSALALWIVAIIGKERLRRAPGVSLVEQRTADEVVRITRAAMLRVGGRERA